MENINPDAFKQKILAKYPNGVTSDGKKYSDLDSVDLTKRIVTKFPDGVTSDGVKYSDYLTGGKQGITPNKIATSVNHKNLLANAQSDAADAKAEAEKANSVTGFLGNFGKELVSNVASSEVGLGKSISKIFGNQSDTYLNLIQNTTKTQSDLLKTIREKKTKKEDTSKLESLYADGVNQIKKLNEHLAEENKLPSTGAVAGQLGGTALDLLTAGTYGEAAQGMKSFELASKAEKALPTAIEGVKNLAKTPAGLFTKEGAAKVLEGGALGYGLDVTQGLQGNRGEDRTGTKALIPGAGTAIGAGIPTVTGAIQSINNARLANKAKAAEQVDNLIGTIVQGKTEDIPKAKAALASIDTTGVKSYKDLGNALDDKIEAIKLKQGQVLDTNTETRNLKDLSRTVKVGEKSVKHNFVKDALDQLESHYSAINDPVGESKIAQLKAKALKDGLTIKEIDNLAVEHGQKLNAFNANGQAASGLSKQAAENTRKGLKATARELFNNPVYKESDAALTNLLRTKDLVENTTEKVNALQQKVKQRGFGEKIGRLVFQVADKFTGGGLKGFVQSFIPRGEGLKVMNALDLEKGLEKNLSKLDEILQSSSEDEIIKKLEDILEQKKLPSKPSIKPLQNYKSVQSAMTARKRAMLTAIPSRIPSRLN